MYPVSEAYLEAIRQRSVETRWYGYIRSKIGMSYYYDISTIVEGSGKVTRQICPGKDIKIGTTCSAQMDLSLRLPQMDRYSLYEAEVTLFYQLRTGSSAWETVPLGIFTVTEPPKRSLDVITLHAYDNMQKFDKPFGVLLTGQPYVLLQYACNACGVELGSTQEEIANFTNGTVETYNYQEVEIYTFKDFVGFVASFLCCFAYIGVDGKLYLKPYGMDPVRTIPESWRFEYLPQDYEAYYTSLEAFFAVTEETETVSLSKNGLTYEMGTNPLIQFFADDVRLGVLNSILAKLAEAVYTPFTAKVPCDPSLMVGDVLNFTGNHAVDGKLSVITKQVIGINKQMELECTGSDPNLDVLTDREKQLVNVAKGNNKDGMYYYDYANAEELHIGDGEQARVILFNYVTKKETHIDFHAELKCEVETSEVYDEDTDAYTEVDGEIYVTYRSGGAEVTEHYPADTFFDGTHLLHLLYTWWASGNIVSSFEVLIRCEGCSIDIAQGAGRGYLAGVGLVGDGAWDGSVYVYEDFRAIGFERIRKDFTAAVVSDLDTPHAPSLTQEIGFTNFSKRMLKGFTESVGASGLHRFSVLYNKGEMLYDHVVVSGSTWIVEEGFGLGTVTTPDCAVEQIVRVTSKHSGFDVAYIVSFDGGETWWTYNNGWTEPDYTQDVYGMFEATMRSITPEQWAEKLTGTIMVRAVLIENASLTDIQIYTEVYQ